MPARFIVFEGIDGSGLSTQASLLRSFVRDTLHLPAHLTKEPTDGLAGAQARLRLRDRLKIDDSTLALVFAADRMDHLASEIVPRLGDGCHVICDRYYLSSLAYQSMDLPITWLRAINARCLRPDLTIFLDVPPEVCIERLIRTRWRLEIYETAAKLERIRRHYLKLIAGLEKNSERVAVVPGCAAGRIRSIEEVAAEVQPLAQALLAGG